MKPHHMKQANAGIVSENDSEVVEEVNCEIVNLLAISVTSWNKRLMNHHRITNNKTHQDSHGRHV